MISIPDLDPDPDPDLDPDTATDPATDPAPYSDAVNGITLCIQAETDLLCNEEFKAHTSNTVNPWVDSTSPVVHNVALIESTNTANTNINELIGNGNVTTENCGKKKTVMSLSSNIKLKDNVGIFSPTRCTQSIPGVIEINVVTPAKGKEFDRDDKSQLLRLVNHHEASLPVDKPPLVSLAKGRVTNDPTFDQLRDRYNKSVISNVNKSMEEEDVIHQHICCPVHPSAVLTYKYNGCNEDNKIVCDDCFQDQEQLASMGVIELAHGTLCSECIVV